MLIDLVSVRNLIMASVPNTSHSYPPGRTFAPPSYFEESRRKTLERMTRSSGFVWAAEQYFSNPQVRTSPPLDYSLQQTDLDNLIREVFENFSGLCIGEYHRERAAKKFLIDQMHDFQSMGVTRFFFECIKNDSMQKQLDEWFENKAIKKLPEKVKCYLKEQDKRQISKPSKPYRYVDLVRKAKEVGIRVIGLDSEAALRAGGGSSGQPAYLPERIMGMNYAAKQILDAELSQSNSKEKYVILTGMEHGSSCKQGLFIPGISQLMQCPFMILLDSSANSKPGVFHHPSQLYKKWGCGNKKTTVHSIIVLDLNS